MGKRIILLGISICILCLLGACKIKSNSKMSDRELDDLKSEYEQYLSETYPDETFTIELWQEYGETTGPEGLPDYEPAHQTPGKIKAPVPSVHATQQKSLLVQTLHRNLVRLKWFPPHSFH